MPSLESPSWTYELQKYLISQQRRVFTTKDISALIADGRAKTGVPDDLSPQQVLKALEGSHVIVKRRLTSEKYAPYLRYALPNASIYELALSLRPNSFFSHGSAVFLHGLTQQLPRTLHVNKEQSPKPAPSGGLSQAAIDRAFANRPRESNFIFRSDDWRLVLLNGKNTGALEVGELPSPDGFPLAVTKLERTLIDIAVRPNYAGGVHEVLEAYRAAKASVSVNILVATLRKMDYIYPYHQVIGFYMQRAGYEEHRLARLRDLGMAFDFYLNYAVKDRDYSYEWRLFIPKGF